VHSLFGVENPLMDIVAHVDYAFLERFRKQAGTMHLVEHEEVRALLREIRSPRMVPGGSAANTARGVAWLDRGGEARDRRPVDSERPVFNGAVGRDETGDEFVERLEAAGVSASIVRKDAPTGVSVILVTPDGERTMNTFLGACRSFEASDVDFDRLERSRMLYLTGYLWDTGNQRAAADSAAAFARSRARRIPVAFDLADPFAVRRFRDLFREWIPGRVDILFGNRDELSLLTGAACDEDCVARAAPFAPLVVMKIGEKGCLVGREGRCDHVPGLPVKAVDTTGAGDAFAAGFLHGMLRDLGPMESARIANRIAARVVGNEGCCYEEDSGGVPPGSPS